MTQDKTSIAAAECLFGVYARSYLLSRFRPMSAHPDETAVADIWVQKLVFPHT